MKRYLLASLIICVFHITQVQSQEWVKIFPSFDPLGNYNMSLGTFVDEKNGWFTEMFPGRSWQTQDGGLTWNMQIDSSTVWSYNIEFFNSTYGWILGKRISDYVPFLKRTKNGGESWETFSLPGEFVAINFLDSLKGFAGGNDSIYCTVDGGESWQAQTIEAEFFPYVIDIYFVDEQYGWAVGYSGEATDVSVILHTANGGFTWNIFPQDAPILNAVYFPSMMHGCAVGFDFFGGVIMLTNNGGENWEYHYPPSPWLNDVFFTDDSTGWVVGDYGFIWYTEDGGQTWEQVESGTNADLNRIVFVDDGKVGYIFGTDNTLLKYDRTSNSVKKDEPIVPYKFKLFQNYPNPFNSQTVIAYELDKTQNVELKVYDITGKEVINLVNEKQSPGGHHAIWTGKGKYGKEVSSGIYLYELRTESKCLVRKMILSR